MNPRSHINRFTGLFALVCLCLLALPLVLHAQPKPSFSVSYDALPYQDFKDPVGEDSTIINDAQAQLKKLRASLSYPVVFSEGRTVLVNEFTYQLIEFSYKNFGHPLKRLQSAGYTAMLQHRLSQKWSVWPLATLSLASDLKAEISRKDFSYQAAIVLIRHYSARLSLGLGAAYSTQFGKPELIPLLAFDWNNGKNMMARAIIPVSAEFWYRTGPRVDLGLLVSGDGNNFRGDPRIYLVDDPELRYTMLTVGPAAKVHLAKWIRLNVEGGIIGLHRFEFFDGNTEHGSYDLKPSYYFRAGIQIGK